MAAHDIAALVAEFICGVRLVMLDDIVELSNSLLLNNSAELFDMVILAREDSSRCSCERIRMICSASIESYCAAEAWSMKTSSW